MTETRNAEYIENGHINCEYNHPSLGWLPFTAEPDGDTEEMQEVWDHLMTQEVSPYVPPVISQEEEDRANTLSPRQFRYMLAENDWVELWDAVEANAKSVSVELYAKLYAQKGASAYTLYETLAFTNDPAVQTIVSQVDPTLDLSNGVVRAAWDRAKTSPVSAA